MLKKLLAYGLSLALASVGSESLAAKNNPYFFSDTPAKTQSVETEGTLYAGYQVKYEAEAIAAGSYPTLTVWKGSGLTLSLTELKGESVKQVWLDDPSKVVLDYAGELCNVPCRGGVSVLHLKRITGLQFENLPSTPTTTLTIVTVSQRGERIYKFRLTYGKGSPKYLTVTLTPTKSPPSPAIDYGATEVAYRPDPRNIDLGRIGVLEKGLVIAKTELPDTTRNRFMFTRMELFIDDLKKGYSELAARKRNNVSEKAVNTVVKMGAMSEGGSDGRTATEL